jgi:hypothetical protein
METVYRNGRLQDSSLGGETEHTWGLGSGHPPTQSPPRRSIDAENARECGRAVRLGDATVLAVAPWSGSEHVTNELSLWPGYLALCEARWPTSRALIVEVAFHRGLRALGCNAGT